MGWKLPHRVGHPQTPLDIWMDQLLIPDIAGGQRLHILHIIIIHES